MGLDTSHGCWHGAYSAFMRWRTVVAKAAGIPLLLMAGFHRCPPDWHQSVISTKTARAQRKEGTLAIGESLAEWALDVDDLLPLSWDLFKGDPLVVLLSHSDCDGEIAAADCGPIADRLEALLPKLEEMGNGGGHISNYADKTRTFIAGLRLAAAANEPVDFH